LVDGWLGGSGVLRTVHTPADLTEKARAIVEQMEGRASEGRDLIIRHEMNFNLNMNFEADRNFSAFLLLLPKTSLNWK
jgi:hypothetical protein